jgi:hypothetical protein
MKKIIWVILGITLGIFSNNVEGYIKNSWNSSREIVKDKAGILHIVYLDQETGPYTTSKLYYTKSVDSGRTWENKVLAFEGKEEQAIEDAGIVINEAGDIYIFFSLERELVKYVVKHRGSTSWSSPQELPWYASQFSLYVKGNTIYITNGLWIWKTDGRVGEKIAEIEPSLRDASIVIDSKNNIFVAGIYVGMEREEMSSYGMYVFRYDNERQEGNLIQISQCQSLAWGTPWGSSMVRDKNDEVHLVWSNSRKEILYAKYTAQWSSPEIVVPYDPDNCIFSPCLGIDEEGDLHLIFEIHDENQDFFDSKVFYIKKMKEKWSNVVEISGERRCRQYPQIVENVNSRRVDMLIAGSYRKIEDNLPPTINYFAEAFYDEKTEAKIEAEIKDNFLQLFSSVKLYYKTEDQVDFSSVEMEKSQNEESVFEGTIPAESLCVPSLWCYIEAIDSYKNKATSDIFKIKVVPKPVLVASYELYKAFPTVIERDSDNNIHLLAYGLSDEFVHAISSNNGVFWEIFLEREKETPADMTSDEKGQIHIVYTEKDSTTDQYNLYYCQGLPTNRRELIHKLDSDEKYADALMVAQKEKVYVVFSTMWRRENELNKSFFCERNNGRWTTPQLIQNVQRERSDLYYIPVDICINKEGEIYLLLIRKEDYGRKDKIVFCKRSLSGEWSEVEEIGRNIWLTGLDWAIDDKGILHLVYSTRHVYYITISPDNDRYLISDASKIVEEGRDPRIDIDNNGNWHVVFSTWDNRKIGYLSSTNAYFPAYRSYVGGKSYSPTLKATRYGIEMAWLEISPDVERGKKNIFTYYRCFPQKGIANINEREENQVSFSPTCSYPNPFNPECYIPVNAKYKMQNVKCKIYNILGQLVREMECSRVQGFKGSRIYWDGRDSSGLEVPAGVYFYEIVGEDVRRMVVLR